MHLFARPCLPGQIYPCSLEDVAASLARVPEQDLEGLCAVGLVPATRKDNKANARYYFTKQPVIHLFSYPETLRYKQPAGTRQGEVENCLTVERAHGMTIEREGHCFVCVWKAEDLRAFMATHVLLHEIGHHVVSVGCTLSLDYFYKQEAFRRENKNK